MKKGFLAIILLFGFSLLKLSDIADFEGHASFEHYQQEYEKVYGKEG